MIQFSLFLVLLGCLAVLGTSTVLENNQLLFEFSSSGCLTRFVDKSTGEAMTDDHSAALPVWTSTWVDATGSMEVKSTQSTNVLSTLEKQEHSQSLSMHWKEVLLATDDANRGSIWVRLTVRLDDDSAQSTWELSAGLVLAPGQVGLWQAQVSVPLSVGAGDSGELFFPSGMGLTFSDPVTNTGGAVSGDYPSGGCSMQYMAVAADKGDSGSHAGSSGVYVSALDPVGYMKGLLYSTAAYETAALINADAADAKERLAPSYQKTARIEAENPTRTVQSTLSPRVHILSIVSYPENAGVPMCKDVAWHQPYPVAVGLVRDVHAWKGRPLWYEAAELYRTWALSQPQWTKKGPNASRKLPTWFRDNSIWINTNWACLDIFNNTGGSPEFVTQYTQKIASVLDQPTLAMHWYEWQQGPSPLPADRYRFDTHYPDYFPPRKGFKEAIRQLQVESSIYTVPYINGRIFDIESDSFLADDGEQYCTKQPANGPVLILDDTPLETMIETYGSNATFCVANPSTPYWQKKVADVTVELVEDYNSAGVYIDQIGAAKPSQCWDKGMGHTLGGGTYWKNGYSEMLQSIKGQLDAAIVTKGTSSVVVTENCAETYMSDLEGYLVLTTFSSSSYSQTPLTTPAQRKIKHLAPAFAAIYGGYYVAFGAEWFVADFKDKDWFCGKLAATFVTGTQMGWFSLAGTENPQDKCGPMGVGDSLLDPENADMVAFLRLLAGYRRAAVDYFVEGRMARPVMLDPVPPAAVQSAASHSKGDDIRYAFDSVSVSSWHLGQTTMTVLTGNTGAAYAGNVNIDFSAWGYPVDAQLEVVQIVTEASAFDASGKQTVTRHSLGKIAGPYATIRIKVPSRGVCMLEVQLVKG